MAGAIRLNKASGGQMTIRPADGVTSETLDIPNYGFSRVLDCTVFSHSSELSLGSFNSYIVTQLGGTFTKLEASSNIVATCTVYGNNFESGNCGVGLVVDSSIWDHGVGYQYDGAWSDEQQTQIVIGTCNFGSLSVGTHTINFGWRHVNADLGRPFIYLSPNSRSDPRNQQFIYRIAVWEVL